MIDLHTHILPGIDDGAETLEESVHMCRRAAEDGCQALVATPHQRHPHWWNGDRAGLLTQLARLQQAVGPHPRLYPGGEVRVDRELLDELDRTPHGDVLPLANTSYLLIEFARVGGFGPDPETLVHELVIAGWRPILAHPELIPWLASDLPLLERLVELGARLQLTAMSVTGDFGGVAEHSAGVILGEGLAHFLASDCHGLEHRPPGLRRAYETIARDFDEELAHQITTTNPAAVIEDRPVAA